VLLVGVPEPDLKGLVEGAGRDAWGRREEPAMRPGGAAEGEKREGRVPARARRVDVCAAAFVSGMALLKSGKLSALGDSGMVSRNGVELPLVGGPHICGVRPSCAWISRALSRNVSQTRGMFQGATNRLENSRLPYSCDGEPAPSLAAGTGFDVFGGKRTEPPFDGSTGDVLPVEEPECGAGGVNWGM
jgi:hypothetical protein